MATQAKTTFGSLVRGALRFAGIDQGIDFTGKGQVLALDKGVITKVQPHGSGWPGEGALLTYRLLSGTHAGETVYVAEDFRPISSLHVGSPVQKGQVLGEATGSWKAPGIEIGWADAQGHALAPLYPNPHSPKPEGTAFYNFVTGGGNVRTGGARFAQNVAFAIELAKKTGLNFFTALGWASAEGGPVDNPTNLAPGSHYGSGKDAADAVARTLQGSKYKSVMEAAHHNYSTEGQEITAEARAIAYSPWNNPAQAGSASRTTYMQNIVKGAARAQYEKVDPTTVETSPGTSSHSADPVTDAVLSIVDRLTGFVGGWAKRIGLIVAGFALVVLGLIIIGRAAAGAGMKVATA